MDGRLPLSQLSELLSLYSFEYKGEIKEYWIHSTNILSDKKNIQFFLWNDISCSYNKGWICQECEIKQISPFHFYKTDSEEIYKLYEAAHTYGKFQIKKYDDYFMWDIISENKLESIDL
tara:strand:+ start:97 stop:453 length:357 start_codon:yes stop_codon:yes gene_type:complete